jgi:propionate CoA-transferase
MSGGAANEAARKSTLHQNLVRKIEVDGQVNLLYRALPIDVAIIRGTTSDVRGNISLEGESILCDQKIIAIAAKSSGGLVIAQVKQLAASGSVPSRKIAVPGALVDCVVVVDEIDHDTLHGMSFEERNNPALTGELVTPKDEIRSMPFSIRKIIARRAFFGLKPNTNVNLGIGLAEGIASVAAEEAMLDYFNFSTEPGVFGGLMASGRSFGPALNASAFVETNQMFDFYDGGLLDMCFLGAAQISKNGDVNVSRISKKRIFGPGGFIDVSQSTGSIYFMSTFTTNGLEVSCSRDGTLKVDKEGSTKKFVSDVLEKTFSGDEAVRRGQQVFFVTERAVFRRTSENEVIELIEIAPGIDLQKDVLDQMGFTPAISPDLKTMDPRIFKDEKMNVTAELFGSLKERCTYHAKDHIMYLDLFGITLNSKEDVRWFHQCIANIIEPFVKARGPINMVVQYDGFDLHKGLEKFYGDEAELVQKKFYRSVKRVRGLTFRRAQLAKQLHISEWDRDALFDKIDTDHDGRVSLADVRYGIAHIFQIHLTPSELEMFQKSPHMDVDKESFAKGVEEVLRMRSYAGECKDEQYTDKLATRISDEQHAI